VRVLESPSHADDKAEAKRQRAELEEYEGKSPPRVKSVNEAKPEKEIKVYRHPEGTVINPGAKPPVLFVRPDQPDLFGDNDLALYSKMRNTGSEPTQWDSVMNEDSLQSVKATGKQSRGKWTYTVTLPDGSKLAAIKADIKARGERPDGSNVPEGVRVHDTQNLYGGGDWFVVGSDWIWYVQNNGMDGDDWAVNNVRTGGAGAIGWRVPYDPELAAKLGVKSDPKPVPVLFAQPRAVSEFKQPGDSKMTEAP
jgi:hypothetical protein